MIISSLALLRVAVSWAWWLVSLMCARRGSRERDRRDGGRERNGDSKRNGRERNGHSKREPRSEWRERKDSGSRDARQEPWSTEFLVFNGLRVVDPKFLTFFAN